MQTLKDLFGVQKPLIAMCHLEGLPGRPRYDAGGGVEAIVASAAREVKALQDGGHQVRLFVRRPDKLKVSEVMRLYASFYRDQLLRKSSHARRSTATIMLSGLARRHDAARCP